MSVKRSIVTDYSKMNKKLLLGGGGGGFKGVLLSFVIRRISGGKGCVSYNGCYVLVCVFVSRGRGFPCFSSFNWLNDP